MTIDSFDRSTATVAVKTQLQRYGKLFEDLTEKLKNATDEWQLKEQSWCLIKLQSLSYENCSLSELVKSGNHVVDKVICVLAALSVEVETLRTEAESQFFPALFMYGEDVEHELTTETEGGQLKMMGRFLPCLQELSQFVTRCYQVSRNILYQLAALYNSSPNPIISVGDMPSVFETLASLLSVLITLDEIIANQPTLREHWAAYLKMIQVVHHNPKKFDLESENLKPLESTLAGLDSQLMSGYIFQNCAEQPFESGGEGLQVSSNGVLMEQFAHTIRALCTLWEKRAADETPDKHALMDVCSLCLMYYFLYRNNDKRTLRLVWDTYKKLPAFYLVSDIVFTPCQYLWDKLPGIGKIVDGKALRMVLDYRSFMFQQQTQVLSREAESTILKVSEWSNAMNTVLKRWPVADIHAELERRSSLFLRGIQMADSIGRTIKTALNSHLIEQRSMPKAAALSLFRLAELLKSIEMTFERNWAQVLESCRHIEQQLSSRMLKLTSSAKEMLRNDKRYTEPRVDMLCALTVAENTFAGPMSQQRKYVLVLSLCLGNYTKLLRADEVGKLEEMLRQLQLLSSIGQRLLAATDCSFLLWHRNLLSIYFENMLQDGSEAPRMMKFFGAINDCLEVVGRVRHTDGQRALEYFEKQIFRIVEESFLTKLCELVETDLRLCIHTHLQVGERNPFKSQEFVQLAPILALPSLPLRNQSIDIKRYVERYLDKAFYNLTTVALRDWKTYAEMRELARQKFGLILTEAHLPSQTLEQGLDVLEIMRNIQIFVAKYNYNLNTQCFVEKESKSKHLNTLNVRHVSNSIRSHGTGVMNTTVNYTYQYLKKKFYVFSQFLYDEHIKSQLIKDSRYYKDNIEELNRMYPVQRAERFNRAIRKLGVTEAGLTYLDQFRMLITQIGNALGYVRLVRAGGLQYCSQAIQFVPDLDDIVPLAPLCQEANLSKITVDSAENFDSLVADLVRNFAEGTEYFKLLVDVFASEFRNFEKYSHLRLFYMVVPPLTVNFVDHILSCKERMGKKGAQIGEAGFTDDGFSMGVAYILKLLDQYEDFDSLHWFESIYTKCSQEKAKVTQDQKASVKRGSDQDEKFDQAMALKLMRLDSYKRECELVAFSLRSARIFFRTDVGKEIIPKDKDASSDAASVKSSASANN